MVSRNRSLDEFLSGDDGEPPDGTDGGATKPSEGDDGGSTVDSEDGDPARAPSERPEGGAEDVAAGTDDPDTGSIAPTYGWSPAGAACASCGAVVEGRWRGDEGLVCADCKDW